MCKMTLAVLCAVGLALGLAGAAQAATMTNISGVTVTWINPSGYSFTQEGNLTAIANGVGLSGTGLTRTHSISYTDTMWQAYNQSQGPLEVRDLYVSWIFLFPSIESVGLMEVWNYNRPLTDNNRGIKTVNIYTSASSSGDLDWASKGSRTFAPATFQSTYAGEDFTVSWSNVRRVKFVGTDSYNNNLPWASGAGPHSGLSEVQFWTPEPATLALLGLGGLGMLLNRKRK